MKEDLNIMRIVLVGGILFVGLIGYSLWNLGNDNSPEELKTEEYLKKNAARLEAESLKPTEIDSTLLIDERRQNILFIGDSMAEGLQTPLNEYAQFNGHRLTTLAKTSASIVAWVGRDSVGRLRSAIQEIKPTYVILSLGSNELFTKDLETYDKYLQNIVNQLGTTKFVWIGPPKWKNDNGLTATIAKKIGEDRYFPSETVKMPRAGDGIHPTYQGYFQWADSLCAWINQQSRHKIILRKPLKAEKKDTLTKKN
ncbi:MAG: SGNH/GDSL hydrolase family protein [Microscillaceae bacterium]|jgi:lysophospholipase L1-like esterase|nr:SGNH/GDSL hydrolase family protein [Microscillaceae bacterium]